MPWYDGEWEPDPWFDQDRHEAEVIDAKEHEEKMGKYDWSKRIKALPLNTSTYKRDSLNAKLGRHVEEAAVAKVNEWLQHYDINAVAHIAPWTDSAILNSQNGDVIVRDTNGARVFCIEVKGSVQYPSATITESELRDSTAKYFMAKTTIGWWITTMDEARRVAVKRYGQYGSFMIVNPSSVERLSLEQIFLAEGVFKRVTERFPF